MRNGTETTYGLRHVPTGRIVRIGIEHNGGHQFSGEETCTLSLEGRHPRFEVGHMRALLPVLCKNENWYNTSRERPGWGKVDPKELEVVQFTRTLQWEEGAKASADPVHETRTVLKAPFPGFARATRFSPRRIPDSLLGRYFGIEMEEDDRLWSEVAPIYFEEGQSPEDAVGMFVNGGRNQNSGLIVAVAELPDDYPLDGWAKAMQEEGGRLHIAIIDVRHEDGPAFVLTPATESRLAP